MAFGSHPRRKADKPAERVSRAKYRIPKLQSDNLKENL